MPVFLSRADFSVFINSDRNATDIPQINEKIKTNKTESLVILKLLSKSKKKDSQENSTIK